MTASVFRKLALAVAAALAAKAALAQPGPGAYPARPVRVLVGSPAGSGSDVMARAVAQKLTERLGQSVVVDNRAGAAGAISLQLAAQATPDGYTLATLSAQNVTAMLLGTVKTNIPKELAPVTLMITQPYLMVATPSLPADSVKELIALAKARPGALNFSSSGVGSASQMAIELFKYMTNTDMVHIGYSGGGPAIMAVLSGQVSIFTGSILAGSSHFKSGRLIPLGLTGTHRDPAIPDVPTIAESGLPGYELHEYQGMVAPAGTPAPVIQRLNAEIVKALANPELKQRFTSQGAQIIASTPEQLSDHIRKQTALWAKVIKSAGIKLN